MIKYALLFLLFLYCFTSFSQSEIKVKMLLTEKYDIKTDTIEELPLWSYNDEFSKVERLNLATIDSKLKTKELYKVDFFFFDDLHGFYTKAIIMFDYNENSLLMLKPMWYSGISQDFYKKLIGIELLNKKETEKFVLEFEKIIMNDSEKLRVRNTELETNSITYKIYYENKENVFDIIKVILKENKVFEIQRINPKDLKISEKIN